MDRADRLAVRHALRLDGIAHGGRGGAVRDGAGPAPRALARRGSRRAPGPSPAVASRADAAGDRIQLVAGRPRLVKTTRRCALIVSAVCGALTLVASTPPLARAHGLDPAS